MTGPYLSGVNYGPHDVDVCSDEALETYEFGYGVDAVEISKDQLAAVLEGATLVIPTEEGSSVCLRLQR